MATDARVVYDANATDADTSFGAIIYTLGGADAGLLSIDGSTGEVRLLASPNFEAKPSYSFDVIATQGATATTQSVTLGINDLNDVNPVFSSVTTASVNENVATTTVVYDANATDADTSFGAITYTLGGTDAGLLNIDGATGEVRLIASPNFEAKASYSFNVIATQGATATTQSVTLGINDLNDSIRCSARGHGERQRERGDDARLSMTPTRPTPTPASAPSPTRSAAPMPAC